jgi:hypothetical protein
MSMKNKFFYTLIFLLFFSIVGCATRLVSGSSPRYNTMENDYFYLSITPLSANERHCGFRLILKNKTVKTLIIDWNKTFYIYNGEHKGSFLFDSINYENRNDTKLPDSVRGRDIFIKTIWPSSLAEGDRNQWTQMPMESGTHGLEVAIVVDGKVFIEKLDVKISILEK